MDLFRLETQNGPRWAVDDHLLVEDFRLDQLANLHPRQFAGEIQQSITDEPAVGRILPPVEPLSEIWASGVTYLRSREAREVESTTADIYTRVYQAARPELFFKASGWRVVGHGDAIRIRRDSAWSVPEPELVLFINASGLVCGYTAGNDVSSRDIEGENPLYLPQAKVYNRACALGPRIRLVEDTAPLRDLQVCLEILRGGATAFQGETSTQKMKRSFEELVQYLFRELDFPQGAFLFTGTGIVPPETFTMRPGDRTRVTIGNLVLENPVE